VHSAQRCNLLCGLFGLNLCLSGDFAVDGPAIVDCVVAADELPNLPRIDLGLAKDYAIAKIVIAVTGR
jgi:pyruvate dehydrogenase (quinone)